MDCNESHERMSAYLDRELAPSAMAACATHIASCEACSAAYERLSDLQATVAAGATRHAAGNDLRARILADVAVSRPRRSVADFVQKIGTWPWARINFGMATACAAALAVSLTLNLQQPSETAFDDQEIVAAHFRSLQADHLADVASSDRHTVKPWFSGKLDYSPPVVDLAAQDFPLIGGRLDYVHQRSVAGLAYRHGKHVVNLFVWPDPAHHDLSAKMHSVNGFQLLRWSRDGMAYTAVSDMNGDELATFQKLLSAQIDKETKLP